MWQQTMYCQFGQKWSKLHHGPMWTAASSSQGLSSSHSTTMDIEAVSSLVFYQYYINFNAYACIQALVNIPAVSERTIRRDLEASKVTLTSEIQVYTCIHVHVFNMYNIQVLYMYMYVHINVYASMYTHVHLFVYMDTATTGVYVYILCI